jgi:F0F1-type ATP synthase membrane subunit b/b'
VQAQTQEFITEGLANIRARLKKSGLENEEIEARILKTLAEADEARARAETERQMTTKQRLKNQANALRLMIEAEMALSGGEMAAFLAVLRDLGTD